jgi:predicted dienelactone hydrolase
MTTIARHLLATALLVAAPLTAQRYDPLLLPAATIAPPRDFTVRDDGRQRDIPIRIYLPATTAAAPVLLFSHGLGGSRENSAYLGDHWAARGYVVVAMQHVGSDESVWKGMRPVQAIAAMKRAASAENLMLRLADVPAVIDQLARWHATRNHPLFGRLDLAHVGMSGHSFGAITTQGVSGQTMPGRGTQFTDSRIRAAVIFSPSTPRAGSAGQAFGKVTVPWLLMTGTEDTSPIGDIDVADRLAVYPALPPASKYELVLDGAQHSAFGEVQGTRATKRNPNHHRVILALSTAFWDAYLKNDADARAWLDGDGPRTVLQSKDRWQRK